jgi:hypothetical protein
MTETMFFRLEARMGNVGMSDRDAVSRALLRVALKLAEGTATGTVYDDNGANVGSFGFHLVGE